nr:putative disease resistance RPP13-like protein 1 [Populus alba]
MISFVPVSIPSFPTFTFTFSLSTILVSSLFSHPLQRLIMEAVVTAIGTAFLNSAVDLLVQKLGSPGVLAFFKGRKLEKALLEKLTETLNAVNGLLSDAEEKQISVPAVRTWLVDVKDAVYEAEDLLDEVEYEVRRSELEADSQNGTDQARRMLSSLNFFPYKKKEEVVENLEKIFERLERLEEKAQTLQLIRQVGERPPSQFVPTTSRLGTGSHVYGRDDAKKAIMELLLSDDAKGKSLEVIPIVGMGGIGKTTLAKYVYNDSEVQNWFDLKAWIYVSQDFHILKLTKDILKEVGLSDCDSMTANQLHSNLEKKLTGQKLLLVFDDVWRADQSEWDFLLTPLKSGAQGSKIVITTRDTSVASALQSVSPYRLKEMSDDDCWSLFSEHAFSGPDFNLVSQFKEMFRSEIVRRCRGLPLAARSLGSLLKSETDVEKWKKIMKSNLWDLRNDRILPALRVSYYYLPSHLKRCFAYCAILPKGYFFSRMEIIRFWMAEGFLVKGGNNEMEEAGCEVFEDLLSRSFFERSDDSSIYFIMHDFTNDLAKFVSAEFFFSLSDGESCCKFSSKTRHLSYSGYNDLDNLVGSDQFQNLRTFLSLPKRSMPKQSHIFEIEQLWYTQEKSRVAGLVSKAASSFIQGMQIKESDKLLSKFKRLRVLSIVDTPYQLPGSIGDLKHLRYLDLSREKIRRLPEAVNLLYNLQVLILNGCQLLVELPAKMMKFINLYHLDITETKLLEMPPQIGNLSKLQLLTDFFVGKQNGSSIKELGELKCLREELRIWNLQNVVCVRDALEADLEGKNYIKRLMLVWSGDTDDSLHEHAILEQLRPHADVEDLAIVGYGGTKLPDWVGHSSFSNIVTLTLHGCKYCYSFPPLGQLASLKTLSVKEFNGVEVVGTEFYGSCTATKNPFKSLENLTFDTMLQWREWIPHVVENEGRAFPCLQQLCIKTCPNLTGQIPGIHLPSLLVLTIAGCPQLVPSLPSTLQSVIIDDLFLKYLPLNTLPKLKQLLIRRCPNLEFLCAQEEPLENSTSISSGKIFEYPSLEELSLRHCPNLKSVHCFLPSLVKLNIDYCDELESFPGLGLPSFPAMGLSSKLESVYIRKCNTLFAGRKQWDLQRLPSLSSFSFSGCEEVESFPEEDMLLPSTLTSLQISFLPHLKSLDVEGLQHLTSLRKFRIIRCPKLQSMPQTF